MIKFEGDKLEMAGSVGQLAYELENAMRAFYQMLVKNTDQENATDFVNRICANAKKTEKESVMDDLKELAKWSRDWQKCLRKFSRRTKGMATALKHKQRSGRRYQKNHKTMGAAVQSMANTSIAKQTGGEMRASVAQKIKNMFRKKGDK